MVIQSIILIVWILLAIIGSIVQILEVVNSRHMPKQDKIYTLFIVIVWLVLILWTGISFLGLAMI